jgi:hypothetical protein
MIPQPAKEPRRITNYWISIFSTPGDTAPVHIRVVFEGGQEGEMIFYKEDVALPANAMENGVLKINYPISLLNYVFNMFQTGHNLTLSMNDYHYGSLTFQTWVPFP